MHPFEAHMSREMILNPRDRSCWLLDVCHAGTFWFRSSAPIKAGTEVLNSLVSHGRQHKLSSINFLQSAKGSHSVLAVRTSGTPFASIGVP